MVPLVLASSSVFGCCGREAGAVVKREKKAAVVDEWRNPVGTFPCHPTSTPAGAGLPAALAVPGSGASGPVPGSVGSACMVARALNKPPGIVRTVVFGVLVWFHEGRLRARSLLDFPEVSSQVPSVRASSCGFGCCGCEAGVVVKREPPVSGTDESGDGDGGCDGDDVAGASDGDDEVAQPRPKARWRFAALGESSGRLAVRTLLDSSDSSH